MKVYDRTGFPNPIRTWDVVAAKHLESRIEWVPVDLIDAEHKQPDFLAKNPSGVVPVLELDDGTFISESAVRSFLTMFFLIFPDHELSLNTSWGEKRAALLCSAI
jgi:hypothetical protein